MNVTKWISQKIYVDLQTGERLHEYQANNDYVVLRKTKRTRIETQLNNKTHNYEKVGIIEYTSECTREGKQRNLF